MLIKGLSDASIYLSLPQLSDLSIITPT